MISLLGRSVLVTGGGSGLGAATARVLAAHGARVTVVDAQQEPANEKRGTAETSEKGVVMRVRADVTQETEVVAAIRAATDAFGPLFGVVNCAGISPPARVVGKNGACPLEKFERVIKVNLIGTFNVCRLAAEEMIKNNVAETEDRGVIVNTASIAAYDGQIGQVAYAASKGGIVSMTLPLARDLASHRIRVNTICPGVMATPMVLEKMSSAVRESLEMTVPYPRRLGDPSEFAALVHHIMVNRYINGECIRLDGGLRMQPK
ncbi:putative mitochondrial 3-oxoacyl-(acyl-carrier protein) reductase [Trypanosoma theileri]|uniref:Putative mitochondrial 3-oxoacyl-(Acyl-carrier protein) reductase n=1 Tax=Trypanosoma theileri TaxID=67003 RepID=A0A1X0NVZ6_9TRYP|nr:putative mitochondrial 3-oxoacyl-(acyl-carrier protein) reductase [Trypanosoma theileri]ORC88852.1 putative mitochondrial 3-oxoacyl-(acyl-carrier protein) reductase [Trypanosoma theileri]